MSFTLTIISAPANPAVSADLVAKIQAAIKVDTEFVWLMEGVACDFIIPNHPDLDNLYAQLRSLLADIPVDIALQPSQGRRKKLLLADMDSTMIQQECIDELADEVGLKDKVSTITARAMRGEIEFEPALKERVSLLEGLDLSIVDKLFADRITYTHGGMALVQTMKAHGAYCALVSGGFTHFTSRVREKLGFDEDRANLLLEENGTLSGKVGMPILGKEAKRDRLHALAQELKLNLSETMAVGDGANDLAMIMDAGAGVALHAKPAVAAQAEFVIDHGDLTGLLFLQGYKAEEFVLG
ncbi:phosphoserine phosphatase SerB [Cohaesibacter celericrescens]|uniref:Phosphoserine phosphatase n=1 Tax=Cohaesibacter celericrescens TaxID=2067669 RepID=A0A2N5XLV7_9HYPH|nr:phosphoserine phosphatase SerB [Cohaesibacter celericrescens]PLW75484.1 phosphoserine phosphatase SerB [Cohaesibacter celericrescens]PLW78891.1 phosphoserine phosphatase SerB [Cohaesibacter celericrescens]